MFWKPDPNVQLRKCNQLIRKNTRELDRHIQQLKSLEVKTKNLIVQTSKGKNGNTPAQVRLLARELVRIRQQSARLATSKAQLQSVGMQVNEAFSMRKIEGSIKASTSVMKDVNSLVRLPELTGTMRELSQELVRAGIIEEMVSDSLPETEIEEDEEAESEVDKVVAEVVGGRLEKTTPVPKEQGPPVGEEELVPHIEDPEMDAMRQRLEILKS